MESILDLDIQIFHFINSHHSAFWDVLMYWISNKFTWIPLYVLLIYLLIKHFKKRSWIVIGMTLILVLICDQGSNLFKNSIQRPRPCRTEANLSSPARILPNYHCGKYGFFSAHAANSIAITFFVGFLLQPFYKNTFYYLLPWALLNSYSRIYLGVHYPLDIICGLFFGFLCAQGMILVFKKLTH